MRPKNDGREFSVGVWAFGMTGDRFLLHGYCDDQTTEEKILTAARIPDISAIELNYPGDVNEDNLSGVKQALGENGLSVSIVGMDLTGARKWKFGSLSSAREEIREEALATCRKTIDTARDLGSEKVNLWLGQDGFDYCFQTDYRGAWSNLLEGIGRIAEHDPQVKVCIEYKAKEPRTHCLIDSAAKALLICKELGRANVGVTLDVGHSFNAGENAAEAATLLGDRLFHLHFNDNYRNWDDDLIVGSVHLMEFVELLYWLRMIGYDDVYSLDIFPYRENGERAARESIEFLKAVDRLIDTVGTANIEELLASGDITQVIGLIRSNLFPGVS